MIIHYSGINWKIKKTNLLLCSYIFYAAWNPPFVLLLFLSTFVDWNIAKKVYLSKSIQQRKHWLWLSLFFNLGLLSLFKYSGFLLENFQSLMLLLGWKFESFDPGIILPMGISFYTFQTLSYTLDIYFKKLKPHNSFLDYALFVSFFPQLVAGPIVRAKEFLPQLKVQNTISFNTFSLGVSLFIIGIFTKVVLADAFFAPFVNAVFSDNIQADPLSSWLASIFFFAQIFCDFAGYSLCAIGTALCLGFVLPFNFKSPLAAIGFSDFWQRWHISLSSWLRDYLYIPLGGNRNGTLKTFKNLMITMLLGGFWHGAAWTFIMWGFLHGMYLVLERGLKSLQISKRLMRYKLMQLFMMFITLFLVMIAFVVFRAENLDQVSMIFSGLFFMTEGNSIIEWNLWTQLVLLSFMVLLFLQVFFKEKYITEVLQSCSVLSRSIYLSLCLILIFISSGNSDAFIYFQF
ncbi:MAG: MBOAT family protein [Marinicellaceae bacterium]